MAPANGNPKNVTVVGGSVAGMYTAGLLARGGARVELLERAERLEPISRTLIVTSHMRDLLGAAGEPCIVNEIKRFELFTDGRAATIDLKRPDLIIERTTLIKSLAEQAQSSGVNIRMGRKFLGLEGTSSGIKLLIERAADGVKEDFESATVVGADGAASKVAEAAGWPRQKTVPLVQAIVKLPADYPPGTVRVWFVPDDTSYFYWLIPEADGRGALGLIGEDGAQTRRVLERFLEKNISSRLAFRAHVFLFTPDGFQLIAPSAAAKFIWSETPLDR